MTYNREKILSLFSSIEINDEFTQDDADEFYQELPDEIKAEYQDYNFGASKFVLIPNNYDYVIKIPFTGTYFDSSDTSWGEFQPFECAWHSDWDYCKAEVQRYKFAEEHNLEGFLAKTEFLDFINGHPFYIQEKCATFSTVFDMGTSHHSKEDRTKTVSLIDNVFFHINIDWLTDCRLYFGEEKFLDFIHFIEEQEWDDLREDNIGYLNGRTVLIDYSGYCD